MTSHGTEVPENNLSPHILERLSAQTVCTSLLGAPPFFPIFRHKYERVLLVRVWMSYLYCGGMCKDYKFGPCVLTVRDSRQLGFLPSGHVLEVIPAMHCYHTEDIYGGCNFIHWNVTRVALISFPCAHLIIICVIPSMWLPRLLLVYTSICQNTLTASSTPKDT